MGRTAGKPPRVAVLGAGRMGRELIAVLADCEDARLSGVWTRSPGGLREALGPGHAELLRSCDVTGDLDAVLRGADVAIDFTLPAATPGILEAAGRLARPLVCGVSGLDDAVLGGLEALARELPVFYDRNMSYGIAVITELVERAAAALGPEFVAEVHETHHVHKRDAPSGTALMLGEALAAARGADLETVFRYDAGGSPRRASPADIVFLVRREGEVPGEHTVVFRSPAETLELAHRVRNRRVFAEGAVRAAKWLIEQPPGLYRMRDLAAEIAPDR